MSGIGTFFFATKTDLYEGLKRVEQNRAIQYVKCGKYDSPHVPVYETVDDLQDLGVNTSGDHVTDSFLVLDRFTEVKVQSVQQNSGGVRYFIDQKENLDSIIFWPGGFYEENYLIHGRIATVYDHKGSQDLYKYFKKKFVKGFAKQRGCYLGSEALLLPNHIRMITINIKQPVLYDFKRR